MLGSGFGIKKYAIASQPIFFEKYRNTRERQLEILQYIAESTGINTYEKQKNIIHHRRGFL